MNPAVSRFFKDARHKLAEHSPAILTGAGVAGMITTTVLAVGVTPKAMDLIEEAKREKNVDKLTPVETVKATWKCYIPPLITGATSIACIILANSVHAKRSAALATAYKLSETALAEYSTKVIETVGKEEEERIRDKVADEQVRKNPVSKSEVIIIGDENVLFFDPLSSRYFKTDRNKVERAVNVLNYKMIGEMYMSLNEFYDEIGVPHTETGDMLGWNMDDGIVEMRMPSSVDENGKPCLVLEFNIKPKYGYSKLY